MGEAGNTLRGSRSEPGTLMGVGPGPWRTSLMRTSENSVRPKFADRTLCAARDVRATLLLLPTSLIDGKASSELFARSVLLKYRF